MALDKEKLLAARAATPHGMEEDDVDVPGYGTVRVRGLNRLETMGIQRIEDTAERERHMIACGLVEPTFTLAEAETWQRVTTGGGELETVTRRIGELSKLVEGADKSDGARVRRRPKR